MSLKTDIFDALRTLVADRVTPDKFEQEASLTVPAIRYTRAGGATWADLEGDGDESTDDIRLQIDWVARTADERDALTPLIRAAMKTLDPPCLMDGPVITTFDAETKLYRAFAFWVSYGSSTT
ncbi:MAG: DUF3168 domain-containing protein [Betaproteobacteria bacterium]|nr:DUF3168 domain-containing protein [Betaproteobacteria bacterium]